MGLTTMYAGHEYNFECRKNKKQIRARNTSDAVSTSSLAYKLKKTPIFFFCGYLFMYLVVI